jgi:hypothetical protein
MAPVCSTPVTVRNVINELEASVGPPLDQVHEEGEWQKLRLQEAHVQLEKKQQRQSWLRRKDAVKEYGQRVQIMNLWEDNKRLKRQLEELKAKFHFQTILPEKEYPTGEKKGLKRKAEQLEAKVPSPTIVPKKNSSTSAQDSAGIFDAFGRFFGAAILLVLSQVLSSELGLPPAVGFIVWLNTLLLVPS